MSAKPPELIKVYSLPPNLPTSPYLDQLYGSMHSRDLAIQRVRPRYTIPALLFGRGKRILHLHFFDEITQHHSQLQTAARTLALLALLALLRLRGVKIVWTAHNIAPHETYHPRWGFVAYRCVIRLSDRVISHSYAAQAMLEARYGPIPRCVVIPHGSYIDLYGPAPDQSASRSKLGLPQHGMIWLALGTVRPYKGLEDLLAAFALLPAHQRGTLLIAGSAKDRSYAERIQALAAQLPDVRLDLQFVPDAQLPIYLAAADMLVLPYHTLLTSGVLLWALSYARPVIAPHVGPVLELVQEGAHGFLFTAGDAAALHAAMERALAHPDLDQLGRAALQVAERFDWPTIAATTAEQYRAVYSS